MTHYIPRFQNENDTDIFEFLHVFVRTEDEKYHFTYDFVTAKEVEKRILDSFHQDGIEILEMLFLAEV